MFEDRTYEVLLAEALASAPPGIDNRQGSIYYDSLASMCLKLAELYVDLGIINTYRNIEQAVDADLDSKLAEHGLERLSAEPYRARAIFVGASPAIGERFFSGGVFFVLRDDLDELYPDQEFEDTVYIEAQIAGTAANIVIEGDGLVPVGNIDHLESAVVGELITPGTEEESNNAARQRLFDKISGPSENGNRSHYKTWCKSRSGVGNAMIFPLSKMVEGALVGNTPNWVTAVLVSADGTPVTETVVNDVQEYIDPDMAGLGEGVGTMGAHCMVLSAADYKVPISCSVTLAEGYTLESAIEELTEIAVGYFKSLALLATGEESVVVRQKKLGALFAAAKSIVDYDDLLLHGQDGNVDIAATYVAVLDGDVAAVETSEV